MPKINNDTYSGADFASGKVPGTKDPQKHGGIQGAEVVAWKPERVTTERIGRFEVTTEYVGRKVAGRHVRNLDYIKEAP